MRNVPVMLRPMLVCVFLTLSGLTVPHLYAQEYVVMVGAHTAGAVTSSKQGMLTQQIRYSIPLTINPRQIDDILQNRPGSIAVSFPSVLPLPAIIPLHAFELFTPDARSYRGTATGDEENTFRSEWISYRGELPGEPHSIVVMNFSRSGADAMILMKGQTYFIQSTGEKPDGQVWPHVFYAAAAVKQQTPFRCGVTDAGDPAEVNAIIQQLESQRGASNTKLLSINPLQGIKHDPPHVPNPFGTAVSSDTIEVRVALEGDYELFLAMGSEQAALNLMMSTASYASAVYLDQVTVKLTVPFIRVWTTESNPYSHTDLFTSLDSFVRYWSQNMSNVDRTVAHLFTNSARWTTISGYVGDAKLNSLCSNLTGYGVTDVRQPSGDAHLMTFTHELGHNFGAHHTHSCYWPNGPLDYCAPIEEGSCYTGPVVQSNGTIMSYCTTRTFEFGPVVAGLIRRNAEFASCAPSVNRVTIALADSTALDNLYISTGGHAWRTSTNWQTGPVSQRFGITVRGGRVISVNLPADGLSGPIPTALSDLTGLHVLNLSGRNKYHVPSIAPPDPATDRTNGNTLSGQIPAGLGQLSALEELDLSNNSLSGPIPSGIFNLQQLRVLNLSENAITGPIPSTIGNLTNLETLDLWRTNLGGQIPSSIGNLHLLRVLVLSETFGSAETQYTRLNGTIPPEIGTLRRLSVLDLSGNALSGEIPSQIGNLTSLTVLSLGQNKLTGLIPGSMSALTGLSSLSLNDNDLTGGLPSFIGSYTSLSAITVANNRLTGPIPEELGNITGLLGLHLENNSFSGNIPASLGRLTSLLDFDVHGNSLTGTIPDSLRSLGTAAPSDFGGLLLFRVGDNKLTGTVPAWLSTKTTISQLDLGGNLFDPANGPIPDWIFNRPSLSLLHLHDMKFTGSFPAQVFQFASLNSLKLSGNQLTGSIPTQIGTMTALNVLWLSNNRLSGTLPTEIGNLRSLTDLRLSNNSFSGSLPASMGDIGGQLKYLYLNGNQFSGVVPSEYEEFGSLIELALNDNELEGIPRLFRLSHAAHDSAGFIAVQNNRLTFGSMVPMMQAGAQIPFVNFTYVPQKPFGAAQLVSVASGAPASLTITSDDPANTFQWSRNGVAIQGATKASYTIAGVTASDTGQYVVTVRNPNVPLLTLQSQPFTVRVTYTSKPGAVTLLSPADGSVNVQSTVTVSWNPDAQAASYRLQLAKDSSFSPTILDTTGASSTFLVRGLSQNTKYYWRVSDDNPLGSGGYSKTWTFTTSATVSAVTSPGADRPTSFRLDQNYPNPFNPSTMIRFAIPKESHVRLGVYTLLGQLVGYLVDDELSPGTYSVRWNASPFTSGVYLYRIQAGTFSETRKLFLLK